MNPVTKSGDDRVLEEIRRRNQATVQQLSDSTGVTQTAVRQRLHRLMGMGMVQRREVKAGRGRPYYVYGLTEQAQRLFGSNYADLAITLWQEIKRIKDRAVRREVIRRICDALVEKYQDRIPAGNFGRRMSGLAEVLAERGVALEVDHKGSLPIIRERECPYSELAEADRGICAVEKQMFEKLLGSRLRLSQCRFDGHDCCEFETRPQNDAAMVSAS